MPAEVGVAPMPIVQGPAERGGGGANRPEPILEPPDGDRQEQVGEAMNADSAAPSLLDRLLRPGTSSNREVVVDLLVARAGTPADRRWLGCATRGLPTSRVSR
jgi:hypothetical protein